MTRYRAAAIHLVVSALVAGVASVLLQGVWYPPPYFRAGGGATLLLLLVGVDVALGPLLTLVVFKSGKPSLKFDLTTIVLLQTLALAYGFHVMLQSRPVFLVAAVDRFVVVAANELEPQDIAQAADPKWRKLSSTGPILVGSHLPESDEERSDLMFSAIAGKDIEHYPRYYTAYETAAPALLQRAQPLSQLRAMHPSHAKEIDRWLRRHAVADADVAWLPIVARMHDLTMLMDKSTGKPLGAIPLDPWEGEAGWDYDNGQPS